MPLAMISRAIIVPPTCSNKVVDIFSGLDPQIRFCLSLLSKIRRWWAFSGRDSETRGAENWREERGDQVRRRWR